MRCPLVRVGFDCVAQPTTKQAKAPANARLRHLGISVSPSIAVGTAGGKRFLRKPPRGQNTLGRVFSTTTTPSGNGLLTRNRSRELGRAMRTTRRLYRNLHRARRTIFRVDRFFGWMSKLIDNPYDEKNRERNDQEVND